MIGNTKIIDTVLFDTAGEEKYHALQPLYYRNADGVILVFDLTRKDTLKTVEKWIEEVRQFSEKDIKIILCGNKNDQKLKIEISQNEIDDVLKANVGLEYFAISAKENDNVDEAYTLLVDDIVKKGYNTKLDNIVKINEKIIRTKERKNKNCC